MARSLKPTSGRSGQPSVRDVILARIPGDPAAAERLCAAAVECERELVDGGDDVPAMRRYRAVMHKRDEAQRAYAATVPSAKAKTGKRKGAKGR